MSKTIQDIYEKLQIQCSIYSNVVTKYKVQIIPAQLLSKHPIVLCKLEQTIENKGYWSRTTHHTYLDADWLPHHLNFI